MKIAPLFAISILLSSSAFGQGKVSFSNGSDRPFVLDSTFYHPADVAYAGQPVPTAGLPSGILLHVDLYAGTTAGSLSLQTSVSLSGTSLPDPGRMASKGIVLNDVPGGSLAYFDIFVWGSIAPEISPEVISSPLDFKMAVAPFYFGESGIFTLTPSAGVTRPPVWAGDSTWASGALVIYAAPEPSSFTFIALAFFSRGQIGWREQKQSHDCEVL